jgi:ribonuclease BN (tRNA processing enzyme)
VFEAEADSFEIRVMQAFAPSHPQQGALYYRIKDLETGKSVACIWDNESKIGGDKAVIKFSKGADVMIHDTQYTTEEYTSDKMIVQGFGHSTYEMALDNATQANVGKLVGIHYNPAHTDEKLDEIAGGLNGEITLAREGMEIEV